MYYTEPKPGGLKPQGEGLKIANPKPTTPKPPKPKPS